MSQVVSSSRRTKSRVPSAKAASRGRSHIPLNVESPRTFGPSVSAERDFYSSTAFGESLDRSARAAIARFTLGCSPAALAVSFLDWATHLASSPGKQMELVQKAMRKFLRLAHYYRQCSAQGRNAPPCIEPLWQDRRFSGEAWQQWPYNFIYQSFLLHQQWWHNATTGVRGVTKQHENAIEFATRQILDVFAPTNFLSTNPELQQRTVQEGGANLWRGAQNFVEDWEHAVSGKRPAGAEIFKVGRDVAITPGKVIYRNRLIELIQYAPATEKTRPEPILIVPAWIMKYYILDLSPHNSLVKYLTEQGFTVFMISWKNPDRHDRDLSLDDYRTFGVMSALDAVSSVMRGGQPVHAVGYCLGGTLLSIAAAAMSRDGDNRLRSITLLAAQTDFHEAGELMLFINESQISFLEDMMWEQGYLDGKQMAGAFQLLRSNDLIWSRNLREYLMGERDSMNDLMAWNADTTRMPYRMHSEYLRDLYLNNDLAEGHCLVDGKPGALTDIETPIFVVGTTRDHVAPWRSVYKTHLLTNAEITFLLTTGGHNAGIISEPGRRNRSYQVMTRDSGDRYTDPDIWAHRTPHSEGSWWPEWVAWLEKRSTQPITPPPIGGHGFDHRALTDAPGLYVLQE